MSEAVFDANDHCLSPGWASHQKPDLRGLCRWFRRHVLPGPSPVQNGHSPRGLGKCRRCGAPLKWFVLGQHRYGGYDKDVFDSFGGHHPHPDDYPPLVRITQEMIDEMRRKP